MRDLSTSETKSNDEIVEAFISVLNCTRNEAIFFLESSLWEIEKAVHFWLESDKSSQPNRRFRNTESSNDFNHIYEKNLIPKYEHRNVVISDLPQDWSAWINPQTGNIYFLHTPSGVTQYNVPPGYADVTNFEEKEPEFLEDSERLSNVSLSHHNNFGNLTNTSDDRDGESVRADCDSHTHTNDDLKSGFDEYDELKFSTKSSRSSPTDFQSLTNNEESYLMRDSDYIEELDDINEK